MGRWSEPGQGRHTYGEGETGSGTDAGQGHTGADQTADRLQAAKSRKSEAMIRSRQFAYQFTETRW
jgi:hypothetical protein